MISQSTIDEIKRTANISAIVGKYVKLKKSGSGMTGLCPFHEEKTPSFHVSDSKGIYKCFGCGESGDVIEFVQKHEGLEFHEAVRMVASEFGIEVQEDSPETREKRAWKEEAMDLMQKAWQTYHMAIVKDPPEACNKKLTDLGYTRDIVERWGLGYAAGKQQLTGSLSGEEKIVGRNLGLLREKDGYLYDTYRERLIFPILSLTGKVIALAGRRLSEDKKYPKYINSDESDIYRKTYTLFGAYQAKKAIMDSHRAYLVEGYTDVISMHRAGFGNTVASCGTSVTAEQMHQLKRWANHIIIIMDGDEAGRKALIRAVELALDENFRVDIVILPEGEDPESMTRAADHNFGKWEEENRQNGVLWLIHQYLPENDDPDLMAAAYSEVAALLLKIPDETRRENYLEIIAKDKRIKKIILKRKLKELEKDMRYQEEAEKESGELALPPEQAKQVMKYGFYSKVEKGNTGYYFHQGGNSYQRIANFVIEPLYHIYSKNKENNKRMIKINNGIEEKLIELTSENSISLEGFRKSMWAEGPFFFRDGLRHHLDAIMASIMYRFPLCFELTRLGWQPEGFFSYSDHIYSNELKPFNSMGIVTHDKQNYFSPSASEIYAEFREGDDEYENDRYIRYSKPPIDFNGWCALMHEVYPGGHSYLAISFVFVTLFRDIIFNVDNNCPLLYAYGQKGSGKSKYAESISALFFTQMPAYNLKTQSTDFSFYSRLQRFNNCPAWFNELDNETDDGRFKSFKGVYDGESRERGKGGSRNRTEIMRFYCTVILTGQVLVTKDDNAVLSRCLTTSFTPKPPEDRTEKEISAYNRLKAYEKVGLNGLLVEILRYRSEFEAAYKSMFDDNFLKFREALSLEKTEFDERVMRNYCAAYTCSEFFSGRFELGFEMERFFEFCKDEIIRLTDMMRQSDSLADFWNTVVFLLDKGDLEYGFDMKIESRQSVKISRGRAGNVTQQFKEPKKLLFVRIENVHKAYVKFNHGKGLDLQSLRHYIENTKSYIGNNPGSYFRNAENRTTSTSSLVFDYEALNVNIERIIEVAEEEEIVPVKVDGIVFDDPIVQELRGRQVIRFTLFKDQISKGEGGLEVHKPVYTSCFYDKLSDLDRLRKGAGIRVTGVLQEKVMVNKNGERYTRRTLNVMSLGSLEPATEDAAMDETPF